jgi:predicted cupin superfamily sugar epimerase
MDAPAIIAELNLTPHPEGGYFRETYRSGETLPAHALPPRYGTDRTIATSIYFLLTADTFSAFHRLQSDELWHFHLGDPVTVHLLHPDHRLETHRIGPDLRAGHQLHLLFPAGCWFAAAVEPPGTHTLVGCTVAPGFDFADFELARRADLTAAFPAHADLIHRLTRT